MAKKKQLPRGIREFKNKSGGVVYKVQIRLANGKRELSTCHTLEEAIAVKANQSAQRHRVKLGLTTLKDESLIEANSKSLETHVGDFIADLKAKGVTGKHADLIEARIKNVIKQGHLSCLEDFNLLTVRATLQKIQIMGKPSTKKVKPDTKGADKDQVESCEKTKQPLSEQTMVHYVRALKEFSRWLDITQRMSADPLRALNANSYNPQADPRHTRRAFTNDELMRLFKATEADECKNFLILNKDRAMLYRVAVSTGFRAKELGHLTPAMFHLDPARPAIILPGKFTKNGQDAIQPIRHDLAEMLRGWLNDKPANMPVFPHNDKQAKRLYHDMKNAGIVRYLNGAYLDFHSFRHTYITRLATNKDIALPTAQKLARHSTINLTMRYTHVDDEQMYKGLKALPGLGEPSKDRPMEIGAE